MELHDHLYALGLRMGRGVFDDADGFRGALDDFLDEDAATTGDINLLVDAVRLGAFGSMTTLLDGGADVHAAIEEAGGRLARDRGSVDVAGARWAVAVLGFAVGRVSDPDVRRYRTQHPQSPLHDPGSAPTMLPTSPPQAQFPPPQQQAPPYAPPQPAPQSAPQPPPHVSPPHQPFQPAASFPPPGGHGPASWPAPGTPRKRKIWPVLVAVVAVLAIVGGVGIFFLVTRGDDDPEPSARKTSDGPTTETTDPTATDFESVNARYAGLAELVTTSVDSCEQADTMSGQSEHLECGFASGTLELVTYGSDAELRADRKREVTHEAGGVYLDAPSGTLMAFEEEDDEGNATSAFLYWDDDASLQSAKYTAASGVDLDELVNVFRSTEPSVTYPEGPTSPELIDFASQWFQTAKCNRIETIVDDELEENFCDVNGPVEVYIGQFENFKQLRTYRKITLANAKEDDRELRTWNQNEGDPPEGALYEYLTDSGTAVRYWDQPDCNCYAEAFLSNGSFEQLKNWWFTG